MSENVSKASEQELRGARRMYDLTTNEVSVVDRPAIRRTFVITKSVENAEWSTSFVNDLPDSAFLFVESGGKKDADGKTVPRTLRHFPFKDANGKVDLPHLRNALSRIPQSNLPASTQERLTREAQRILEAATKEQSKMKTAVAKALEAAGFKFTQKELPTDLKAALDRIIPWMQDMASKAQGQPQADLTMVAEFLGECASGSMPVAEAEKKADPSADPNAAPNGDPNAKKGDEVPKQKSLSLDDGDVVLKVDAEGNLKISTKGSAKLSPLGHAAKQILDALAKADPEEFKKVAGTLPNGKSPTQEVVPTGLGSEPKLVIKEYEEKVATLEKRVKDLESSKQPSQGAGGGDGAKPVAKSDGKFWGGIF